MLHPRLLALGLLTLATTLALADSNSPVGNWKNISDKTNKPEAIIQIWEESGELHGKLIKLFDQKETLCKACKDDKKDKPLIGLEILWGLKKDGQEWEGGKILDPDNGTIYSAKLALIEGGQKLKVRGFLGFSLFGRSQIWVRD